MIIIKSKSQIGVEFAKTEEGKKLYDEVKRLYEITAVFDEIEEDDWTEKTSREFLKAHRSALKAYTAYKDARDAWYIKGLKDGTIIDHSPSVG